VCAKAVKVIGVKQDVDSKGPSGRCGGPSIVSRRVFTAWWRVCFYSVLSTEVAAMAFRTHRAAVIAAGAWTGEKVDEHVFNI
jgi:hypothetical protein